MGLSQTRRKSKKHKHGGRYLGEGTYGCAFYPALFCKDDGPERKEGILSKLMIKGAAEEEWKAHTLLKPVDPDQEFFLYPTNKCRPDFRRMRNLVYAENNLEACTIYSKKLAKNPYDALIIESRMGGKDLNSFTLNTAQYLPFFKGFEQLLEGLALLHSHDMVHLDIKDKNLVAKETEPGHIDFHFIDFGFTTRIADFDTADVPVEEDYQIWPYEIRFTSKEFRYEKITKDSVQKWKEYGNKYYGDFLFGPCLHQFTEAQYKKEFNDFKRMDREDMLRKILKGADVFSLGLVLGQLWNRFIGHSNKNGLVKIGSLMYRNRNLSSSQQAWHLEVAKNLSKPIFQLVCNMMNPNVMLRLTAKQAYDQYKLIASEFDTYLNREQLGKSIRMLFPDLPSPQPVPPTPHGFEFISTNLFQSPQPPSMTIPPPPSYPPPPLPPPPPSPYYEPRSNTNIKAEENYFGITETNFSPPPEWSRGGYKTRKNRKTRKQG